MAAARAAPRRTAGGMPLHPGERSSGECAADAGFTPAEIIIGVILVGILATGVTVKAVQLMDRARDSAAQRTLRAADVAAQAAFSVILPGGQSNFASKQLKSNKSIDGSSNDYSDGANGEAMAALQAQEPGLQFTSYTIVGVDGLKDLVPDGTVWVEINNKEISNTTKQKLTGKNPNGHTRRNTEVAKGVSIRAGEMIRLGIAAASGSTFCLISVADSSDGSLSGDGWQAVSELLTKDGRGADCGADFSVGTVSSDEFKEMPGTPGTDPRAVATRHQAPQHGRQALQHLIAATEPPLKCGLDALLLEMRGALRNRPASRGGNPTAVSAGMGTRVSGVSRFGGWRGWLVRSGGVAAGGGCGVSGFAGDGAGVAGDRGTAPPLGALCGG